MTAAEERETPFDRFDFTKRDRDALNTAAGLGIVDAVEFGCLVAKHGTDTRAILEEILEAAFADHHDPEGRKRHAAMCSVVNDWVAKRGTP